METFELNQNKRRDVREFSAEDVPVEVRSKVLEVARLSGTGLNTDTCLAIYPSGQQTESQDVGRKDRGQVELG